MWISLVAEAKRSLRGAGLLAGAVMLALGAVALRADEPVVGDSRTMSLNTEIQVVPAPAAVVIDGKTEDWDLSGGVWSYNNPTIVDKYSVWTHLMYDAKGVYFLARFADLTPMQNPTTGKDFSNSWRNDCYQARVIFDDGKPDEHQMHVNMFYSAPEQRPYLIVKHGGFRAKPPYDDTGVDRPDLLEKYSATMDAAGGQIACRTWDNGKGYNIEAFWPWSYCRVSGQPLKPDEQFTFGIEALWGGHRLADGIKNDDVNRIFMFRARKGWGRAVISATGKLAMAQRQVALQEFRLKRFQDFGSYGSIPLAYTLPEDREVTIAIDDAQGQRVRNLFGQYPRKAGAQKDLWDGLNDAGKPVPAGSYTATVVDHQPVTLHYLNSVFNAGTPPWTTDQGNHTWGCNHGSPSGVVTRGAVTLATFVGCEGAPGILRVDAQDKVQWTAVDEICDAALDDQVAYCLTRNYAYTHCAIQKYTIADGKALLFADADKSPYKVLPVDLNKVYTSSTIALAFGKLFALVRGPNQLFTIKPDTGEVLTTTAAADLLALVERAGTLYGLYADGTVATLTDSGARNKVLFQVAAKEPQRLAVSQDQTHFAVSASGTNQVLVYDAQGKLTLTLGQPVAGKDRPAGKFIATNLIRPLGVAFDAAGCLWVAEAHASCRRVTRWSPAGELQREFWGGADYGAMSGFPLTYDSTRFIAFGLEFQLDPKPQPFQRPTAEKALLFHPALYPGRGLVYRCKDHEYAVNLPGYNHTNGFEVALRGADQVFTPCVRVVYAHTDTDPDTRKQVAVPATAWVDRNDNGKEDEGETVTLAQGRASYWSSGWCRPDLVILTADQALYRPQGFSPAGVPLYDFTKPEQPATRIVSADGQGSTGTVVMDQAGGISDGIAYRTVDGHAGKYPNPYGRHDAPAAQRGLLIAPFRTNGVVEGVPGVGSVTALGGDRGEWFLLSMDGLYLSSICQDSKGEVTLDDTFIGQESFGGFFWKDEQGRLLVQLGGPAFRIMELKGLETTRKQQLALTITAEQVAAGQAIAEARRRQGGVEASEIKLTRVAALPAKVLPAGYDADKPMLGADVPEVRVVAAGNPAHWFRTAFVHDGTTLAMQWQVADDSPWKNGEGRFTHAFIGGDGVDVKLDVPGRGPIRLLVAPVGGQNVAIYWQQRALVKDNAITYQVPNNPGAARPFDVVRLLPNAKVSVDVGMAGYTVLVTVPLADLGLDPAQAKPMKGLAGVIYSNSAGTNRLARLYWKDKSTDLVSDVPSESALEPQRWGPVQLAP